MLIVTALNVTGGPGHRKEARAEGRHEGGNVEVMHFVDLIVQREGGCKR